MKQIKKNYEDRCNIYIHVCTLYVEQKVIWLKLCGHTTIIHVHVHVCTYMYYECVIHARFGIGEHVYMYR